MRSLRAGQDLVRCGRRNGGRRREAHLDALMSHELHTGAPMFPSAGVAPEERSRTNGKRMQQHADLARFGCGAAVPLTLVA
jgi:hypothetical protein